MEMHKMFSDSQVIISASVFLLTYLFIVSEKINRTAVALLGAAVMLGFKILSQESAFEVIDFNTIGLLIGMMIIVSIAKRTGMFQYIAIKAAKMAKGDPWKILVTFSIITAVSSALLDNVTTVLLIVPVTLVITDTLKLNPISFLIPEILAANIGGTATLIGDPPNIMIGSATNLGFIDFLFNLGPIAVVVFIVTLLIIKFIYKKHLSVEQSLKEKIMSLDENKTIRDKNLLIKSLIVLGFTMVGFSLHQMLGYESATVALIGGTVLLVISKINPEEIFLEIEWPTIFFFVGLFILVGALEHVGIIEALAESMVHMTKGNLFWTAIIILWVSAFASAFIDNIPFVATMIPLIKSIGLLSGMDIYPLWWALALGACFGGNGSLVGASANVIVAGMVEKSKYKLSFVEYLKIGLPVMTVSIIIATVYLVVFYL